MESSEKERLFVLEKVVNLKDEILQLTTEILDLLHKSGSTLEIRKKITSILSKLNTGATLAKSETRKLDFLTSYANLLFFFLRTEHISEDRIIARTRLEDFCNYVNSIRFDVTKKGLKIHLPKVEIPIVKTEMGAPK